MARPTPRELVHPQVEGILPDAGDGKLNLLPMALVIAGVEVVVPPWANMPKPGEGKQRVGLFVNGQELYFSDIEEGDAQAVRFYLMPYDLPDGPHTLHYEIFIELTGMTDRSDSLVITVDTQAPQPVSGSAGQLQFPPEVVSGGVTDQWLQDHGETLNASFPAYSGALATDVITWYWQFDGEAEQQAGRATLGELQPERTLSFPGAPLRERGQGHFSAFYQLADRAGNTSNVSWAASVAFDTRPIPRVLPPAQVEQASGTGAAQTLKATQGVRGVSVQVPAAAVINPGERVVLHWGQAGEAGYRRIDPAVAPGTNELPAEAAAAYLEGQLQVRYEVTDAKGVVHGSDALVLAVQADFTLAALDCLELRGRDALVLSELPSQGATLYLHQWAMMHVGQFIRVSVTGLDASSGKSREVEVVARAVIASEVGQTLTVLLPVTSLSGFKPNVQADIQAWVSFDRGSSWPKAYTRLTPRLVPSGGPLEKRWLNKFRTFARRLGQCFWLN